MTTPTGWLCPSCGKAHGPPCLYTAEEMDAIRAQRRRAADLAMEVARQNSPGLHPRVRAIREASARA